MAATPPPEPTAQSGPEDAPRRAFPVRSPEEQLELARQVKAAVAEISQLLLTRPEGRDWFVGAIKLFLQGEEALSNLGLTESDIPSRWRELISPEMLNKHPATGCMQPLDRKVLYWGEQLAQRLANSAVATDASLGAQLLKCAQTADRAFEELVESHLVWVDSLVRAHCRRGDDVVELTQVARVALMHALECFDPSRGSSTRTYCKSAVIGAIKAAQLERSRPVRVPRSVTSLRREARDASNRLSQRHGRQATEAEVAAELRQDKSEVEHALQDTADVSLDATEALDRLADQLLIEPEEVGVEDRQAYIKKLMQVLTPREAAVIILRFGLPYDLLGEPNALEQIGDHYKITKDPIQRSAAKVVRALMEQIRVGRAQPAVPSPLPGPQAGAGECAPASSTATDGSVSVV